VETTYTWVTKQSNDWPYTSSGSISTKEVFVTKSTKEEVLVAHAKIVKSGLERTRWTLKDCTANPPYELVLSQTITEL
jgi:hypothetical protein